jgi:hypothetical protein
LSREETPRSSRALPGLGRVLIAEVRTWTLAQRRRSRPVSVPTVSIRRSTVERDELAPAGRVRSGDEVRLGVVDTFELVDLENADQCGRVDGPDRGDLSTAQVRTSHVLSRKHDPHLGRQRPCYSPLAQPLEMSLRSSGAKVAYVAFDICRPMLRRELCCAHSGLGHDARLGVAGVLAP